MKQLESIVVLHYPADQTVVIKFRVQRGYGFYVGPNYAGSADITGMALKFFPGSRLTKLNTK